MTAEELAEIRKRHASDQRTYEYAAESAGSTRPFGGFGPKQHQDRADLLTHTDAQAQRIAELEAEIERLNAVYDGAKAICDNPPPPNDALKNLMRKTPPWASATAQAVTLTAKDVDDLFAKSGSIGEFLCDLKSRLTQATAHGDKP